MRQFIAGGVVGAILGTILGTAVYAWLARGAPADDHAKRPGISTPVEPIAPVVAPEPPALPDPPVRAPANPVPSPVAPGAAVPAVPRQPVAPPSTTTEGTASTTDRGKSDLSSAHSKLIEPSKASDATPPSVAQLHDRFNEQERDDRWSYYAENNLMAFLGPLAAQQGIDIASIACRETLCEIQASGALDHADRVWSEIVHGIYGQPWGREFSGISSRSQTLDGRSVILTLLQRAGAP